MYSHLLVVINMLQYCPNVQCAIRELDTDHVSKLLTKIIKILIIKNYLNLNLVLVDY